MLPEWIIKGFEIWQANLLLLDEEILKLRTELAQSAQGPRPKCAGSLSMAQMDREIFDYNRFKNPHKVGVLGACLPASILPGTSPNSSWVQSPKSGCRKKL